MTTQHVNCTGGTYDIIIEPGALSSMGSRVAGCVGTQRVLLVADANVADTHADTTSRSLGEAGMEVSVHVLVAEEVNKTASALDSIWSAALSAGLDRASCIVAVGGGLVGDVAGFAAASFLRGIDLVQVPTTLLSMVDASVGGKTGINLPLPGGGMGKNLAGAFWQPKLVIADPDTLGTLPVRERRCGLAETVKHAIIGDPDLLGTIDNDLEPLLAGDSHVAARLIDRAVRVKIDVVEEDEREQGRRAVLNLGHTFAHAIEPDPELDLKHGEAVSIGLVAASALSEALGCLEGDWPSHLRELLERAGLPTRVPVSCDPRVLLSRMRFDKKIQDGRHRLVVPIEPGKVEIIDDVSETAIIKAWDAVTN